MHGEFLVIDDDAKMSKSLGNVLTVGTLAEKGIDPLAYRVLVLQSHYRKQLRFSHENLLGAAKGLERLTGIVARIKAEAASAGAVAKGGEARLAEHRKVFREAMANDLNTPQAFAHLFSVLEDDKLSASEKVQLIGEQDKFLGLKLLEEKAAVGQEAPAELMAMLKARNEARTGKNWGEADRLRKAIADAGYEILDAPEGSSLKRRL
jgi:cysteinyl-tRNA synthetase